MCLCCVVVRRTFEERIKSVSMPGSAALSADHSAFDLLSHLLDPDPRSRYSAQQALDHAFFKKQQKRTLRGPSLDEATQN